MFSFTRVALVTVSIHSNKIPSKTIASTQRSIQHVTWHLIQNIFFFAKTAVLYVKQAVAPKKDIYLCLMCWRSNLEHIEKLFSRKRAFHQHFLLLLDAVCCCLATYKIFILFGKSVLSLCKPGQIQV